MGNCSDCAARRKMAMDALMQSKLSEALMHAAKGAAEMSGIKKRTGKRELDNKFRRTGNE